MSSDRLTLLAGDAGDLPVLSALMQDAIVRAGDIAWDARARRLVIVASRYRWEAAAPSRARSALRVESVMKVQHRAWPQSRDAALSLLAITADAETITIAFAGGASLRAEVECIDAVLEDLSAAWDVRYRPSHD